MPSATGPSPPPPKHQNDGEQGYDGGKKIKGRKRHTLVYTDGRALKLHAHKADIQDRESAGPLLRASHPRWPFMQLAFANAAYQESCAASASSIRVEIVHKPEEQVGFAVHARRWLVARFFAWTNRNRRLVKNVETTIASAEALLYAASAILLSQRLARRQTGSRRTQSIPLRFPYPPLSACSCREIGPLTKRFQRTFK